jgi:hypothetical protein
MSSMAELITGGDSHERVKENCNRIRYGWWIRSVLLC